MRKSIEEITIMRGFAILGIVLLHVTSYTLGSAGTSLTAFKVGLTLNQLVRFSLPLFLVISGFSLACNYDRSAGLNFTSFVGKRIKAVFVPYLFWSLVYFLFYVIILEKVPVGVKVTGLDSLSLNRLAFVTVFLKNLLFGWNYVHLYFVILIFQFYLIYPFVIRKLSGSRFQKPILIVSVIAYACLLVYLFYFRKPTGNFIFDIFVRYYWQMLISWYIYFLFGLTIVIHFQEFKNLNCRNFTGITLIYLATSLLVVIESFLYGPANLGKLTSLRASVFLNTIPAIFFYFRLSHILKTTAPKILGFLMHLGHKSFGVYLVHLLVLANTTSILNKALPGIFNFNRTSFTLVLFVITLLGSLALVQIISYVPYGHLLVGRKNGKFTANPSTASPRDSNC